MHNARHITLRATQSKILQQATSRGSTPVIQIINYRSITTITNPATIATVLMGYIDRPFTITRLWTRSSGTPAATAFTDILISQDDQVDSGAVIRDTRLSGAIDSFAGFLAHIDARPFSATYHVESGKRWIKARTILTAGFTLSFWTGITVRLH